MSDLGWLNSFKGTQLELIVFVTEQCNFRCIYCYEDFKIGRIKPSTIKGIKLFIENRITKIEALSLSFFGGEPLLNIKSIIDLSGWAKDLSQKNGIKYYGGITTNGYLLKKEIFIGLVREGIVNYQVTIDGDNDEHDKLRYLANGSPTFDVIYNNLKSISSLQFGFECLVRFNVCDSNIASVKSFLRNRTLSFKHDQRFSFHFHPIFGFEANRLSDMNLISSLKTIAENEGLSVKQDNGEHICYASKANSYVIRADGRIQKCTVALENEINNVGFINSSGEISIDNEKLRKWVLTFNKSCPLSDLAKEKLVIPYENAGKFSVE